MSDELLVSQAQHEEDNGNWKEAANLFIKCKHYREAINIYGGKGVLDSILNVLKVLSKEEHFDEINLCIKYFKEFNNHTYAKQAILKIQDLKALMALHIEFHQWEEALQFIKVNLNFQIKYTFHMLTGLLQMIDSKKLKRHINKAGFPELAFRIIEFLTKNALSEK